MNDNAYLAAVLESQDLQDGSPELKELQSRRAEVEELLRTKFSDSAPTIRYGGSKAKGTLIKENYDLDIVCYFPRDDEDAGGTLKDIYYNAKKAVEGRYRVEEKTSALRLRGKDYTDLHIDLVPGRFVDEAKTDCFLYQSAGEKDRLRTNLDVHIAHVSNSGVVDAIRLLKLWKTRKALEVKQFVFELAIIELLKGKKRVDIAGQLTHVLTEFRDRTRAVGVEDPANPSGNDLSALLAASWATLSAVAGTTLRLVESEDWRGVFGEPDNDGNGGKQTARLATAAAAIPRPSGKPWCR